MRLKARSTKQHFLFFVAATALLMSSSCLGQASPTPQSASSGTSEDIIPFLNQNIVWYRQLAVQEQLATEPSDVLFLNDNRQIANQVVRLAFDFARARAQALSTPPIPATGTSQGGQFQRLAESAGRADQNVKNSKKQIAEIQHQLLSATGKKRQTLLASLDEAQSELELFQARSEVLHGLLQFATGSTGSGSGNLLTQVEELSHAIPAAAVANAKDANGESNKAATAITRERRGQPSGILAIVTDLFALRSKLQALKENVRQTEALQQSSKDLRTPLVAKLRELSQQGDQLAAAPDSQDTKALAQQSKDLDALTQQYKQLSATVVPLGKQNILLDVYRRSTGNWAKAVETEYYNELKALGVRVAGLTVVLLLVFGISQLTRRATFRYITEPRRRYQILLLRRVLLWTIFTIILVIAFASELSGIGTFAGLLTAGVAFSLQNVILSVVGYFLLIGKYGVRAGDRVQIAGVTGDVVEVGLIRLHLMELTAGPNPHPTGRVAAFSNALVFQAGAGLFKQIPGTSFVWHEITLTLGPESNYREAEQRLMEAVNTAFAEYKEKMELQRRGMERALNSVPTTALKPEGHLHFTPAGLEVVIRYPVELGHAAEMDDRVTRELLAALDREPKLRLLGSAGPVASAHAAA